MAYILDTNACVALIKGAPPRVRTRFAQAAAAGEATAVSTVTVFELWYGAAKSARRDENVRRVEDFLAGPVELWSFEGADARAAGEIRAALEVSGKPIGPFDVLIAGQAIRRGAIVVTANTKEFGRIRGLKHEDWAK